MVTLGYRNVRRDIILEGLDHDQRLRVMLETAPGIRGFHDKCPRKSDFAAIVPFGQSTCGGICDCFVIRLGLQTGAQEGNRTPTALRQADFKLYLGRDAL